MQTNCPRPWSRATSRGATLGLLVGAAVAAILLTSTTLAEAQDGRVFIDINAGISAASSAFTDHIVFTEFVEEGDLDATYAFDSGRLIDIGGGIKLPVDLGVGVAYSRFATTHDANVDAQIPHPFFYDRDRSIAGSATGLTRTETALHLQLRWFVPIPGQFGLSVFGGPTFFNVTQDLVTAVDFSQSYPFDEATFTGASAAEQSTSVVGYHVGADVGFFFSSTVGIGALVRFSRASVDLMSEGDGTVSIETGGFHAGGGLRLRF